MLFFVRKQSDQKTVKIVSRKAAKAAKKSVCSQETFALFAALNENNPV
jgi:hypothetical protein